MHSGIKPLKALGQHFLKHEDIADRIAASITGYKNQFTAVVEIGPGTGILTSSLLKQELPELFCIEIDERSVYYLKDGFPQLAPRIIHTDILKSGFESIKADQFAVIGNFPYNISSQILFKILENYERIPVAAGMFQKEVAERIASGPGNKSYGILSVLLQAHYDIEFLFTVPPSAFIPPPKVESGVIRLVRKENPDPGCNTVLLKTVVKTAFNQRRKTMRNSLKSLLPAGLSELPVLSKRPEQLSVLQFAELVNLIESAR